MQSKNEKKVLIFFFIFFQFSQLFASPLVTPNWMSKNLCNKNIKVFEVGKSFNSYKIEHISCSFYTNFYNDGWRETYKEVSMSLPNPIKLKTLVEKLGIKNSDHIILYPKKNDTYAMAEVTSIYFTLKYLGHKKISILNGGYPGFKKEFPLLVDEGELYVEDKTNYKYKINTSILAEAAELMDSIVLKKNITDSREVDYYLGINKLDRFKDYGTIDGSINIPSMWNLKDRGLIFNDITTLNKIHNSEKKVLKEKPNIYFCYAGLESSLNWFVSHELLENKNVKLYEGSIFDWPSKKKEVSKKVLNIYRQLCIYHYYSLCA